MRRREFITLIGGAAAAWPLAVHAQQSDLRRIGVLLNRAASDPEAADSVGAFVQGMGELGWRIGGNVRIEYRYSAGNPEVFRKYASELVALAPDVILAASTLSVAALQQFSRTIPIVFTLVSDPVGAGIVDSLARPGGNATGFTFVEYSMSGKWLELLKEIAPRVTRAAILRDPTLPAGTGQLGAIQALAPSLGVETTPIDVRDAREIERAIADFAGTPNSGLIVPTSPAAMVNRKPIITLAAQHRLPAVYFLNTFAKDGGLISYGPDAFAQYRQAAGYVDRILKGEKPADLPVQAPTKYELVINFKTAKTLGLDVPASLLARADEVIE
jgi:putative ABC transport system substrate-binding protein